MKTDPEHFHKHASREISLCHLHYHEKHLCVIFLCLLLFIPYCASAADSTLFPEGDRPDKSRNTVLSLNSDIWRAGIGEGFCTGTQVIGISVGIPYGLLVLGSNERHHLSLVSFSYGRILGGVKVPDKWYRGNLEFRAELFGGTQYKPDTRGVIGLTQHIRYHFATGTRLIPYVDAGVGVSLTGIREPDLGGAFQFNEQAIIGANYFLKDNLSINIAMQYLHLSSSAISMPNNGVNTVGCFLGVHWFRSGL